MSDDPLFSNSGSGPYTATWNSIDLGLVEGPRTFTRRTLATPVRSDAYGRTVIDGIYEGGDCFVLMSLKEFTASNRLVLWPYDADFGDMGAIGQLLSSLAKPLVMTVVAGSAAAASGVGPTAITFALAVLAEENDTEILFHSGERNVPVLFRCLPYNESVGDIDRWFTITYPA